MARGRPSLCPGNGASTLRGLWGSHTFVSRLHARSKRSIALISPIEPTCTRSSRRSPRPAYRDASARTSGSSRSINASLARRATLYTLVVTGDLNLMLFIAPPPRALASSTAPCCWRSRGPRRGRCGSMFDVTPLLELAAVDAERAFAAPVPILMAGKRRRRSCRAPCACSDVGSGRLRRRSRVGLLLASSSLRKDYRALTTEGNGAPPRARRVGGGCQPFANERVSTGRYVAS